MKIQVELIAPVDPVGIPNYFNRMKRVFNHTHKIALASKRAVASNLSGFERSYNLASYIRSQKPNIDIVFHLTCFDLDKTNIGGRLSSLEAIGVNRILVVTGDGYIDQLAEEKIDEETRVNYRDSTELAQAIQKSSYKSAFKSIAVAGYPNGNGRESWNVDEECCRLRDKLALTGADTIYTQCIFNAHAYHRFCTILLEQDPRQQVKIIPSVAIFDQQSGIEKSIRLIRGNLQDLTPAITQLDASNIETFISKLCIDLTSQVNSCGTATINLCSFGLIDSTCRVIAECCAQSGTI